MTYYRAEPDTCQCQAKREDNTRCTQRGTHDNGNGVLCTRHHQKALAKKANDVLIVRKPK
jgi:hypothetical protein